MAKRKFGNVEKLPSGRYRARFRNPEAPEEWIKAPATFPTADDAAGWLRAEQKLIEFDEWISPAEREHAAEKNGMTVRELCDRWLEEGGPQDNNPPGFKESTKQSHRRKLELRVLCPSQPGFDSLADERVVEVDRRRIKQWWGQVNKIWPDTGSTNTTAYKRLHTAFDYALHELEIISENPVKVQGAATAPETTVRDKPLISQSEARAMIDNAAPSMAAPVALLLFAGLRLGELLELRRKDLEGLEGDGPVFLRIERNAQRVADENGKQVMLSLPTPKTRAGKREIALPGQVGELLRTHAREYMADIPEALVVTTSKGKMMMDTSFRSRFKRLAIAAGRPDISPHDCRRFFGTMLVDKGRVSLEEARRLMGHESVEQLMEYQRALSGYEERAAAALEELWG